MNRHYKTNPWQEQYMIDNSKEYTPKELAEYLKITRDDVYNFCYRKGLQFKPTRKKAVKKKKRQFVHIKYKTDPAPKLWRRPAAVYNNMPSPYGIASNNRHR